MKNQNPKPPTMNAESQSYFKRLANGFGEGWNRFWFQPADPLPLCVLRILVGSFALVYLLTLTPDLTTFFADDGLLPADTVSQVAVAASRDGQPVSYRWSVLNVARSPVELWIVHTAALLTTAALVAGAFTRVTSILAFVFFLSYVHRAPMLTHLVEPVVLMMLLYLAIGPCGQMLSVDAWRRRRRGGPAENGADEHGAGPSTLANLALRLMQVHLSLFYLTMALAKVGGSVWWRGEAVWWLIARPESSVVDLTGVHSSPLLVNAWTHAVVLFEFSFAILIWIRLARPLLVGLTTAMWLLLALASGELVFCTFMILAGFAFLSPGALRGVLGRLGVKLRGEPVAAPA